VRLLANEKITLGSWDGITTPSRNETGGAGGPAAASPLACEWVEAVGGGVADVRAEAVAGGWLATAAGWWVAAAGTG
jgi:hypothetical protein